MKRGHAVVTTDLTARARAGDADAFRELIGPHRRELQVHCYRILGSVQDAEDALQETLLAAWQGIGGFEERASIRTWLYQVATSRCLNALRTASRRPQMNWPPSGLDLPEPSRLGEVSWLEPYPDVLLEGLADDTPGPEARYEATEAISLAFVTALQLLPPRQRAVLILRDVLGFRASEAASILETTEEAVTSALKRARATLQRRAPGGSGARPARAAGFRRRTRAHRPADPGVRRGRRGRHRRPARRRRPAADAAGPAGVPGPRAGGAVPHRGGLPAGPHLPAGREPGPTASPRSAAYVRDPLTGVAHANGLLVLTLAGERISAITRFDNSVLPRFGLPRTLPG